MHRPRRTILAALCLLAAAACTGQPAAPPEVTPLPPGPEPAPGSPGKAAQVDSDVAVLGGAWDARAGAFVLHGLLVETGEPSPAFPRLPLQLSGHTPGAYDYDPAHNRLALTTGTTPFCAPMSGGSACWSGGESLHLVDLEARAETAVVDLRRPSRIQALVLHPNGGRVALALQSSEGTELVLYQLEGEVHELRAPLAFLPSWMDYSLDGERIVALGSDPGEDPGVGEPGPMTVALLDGGTLEVLWEQTFDLAHGSWCLEGCDLEHGQALFAYWSPAVVRLPGSDRWVIVHADADRMTSVDFGSRTVVSRQIAAETWIDRLLALGTTPAEAKGGSQGAVRSAVASSDGSRVFAVGRTLHASPTPEGFWDGWDEPMGLVVFDPTTGERLESRPSQASRVGLTADGAWVLLLTSRASGPRIETLDPISLSPGPSADGWDFLAGHALGGAPILVGVSYQSTNPRYTALDATTLQPGTSWPKAGGVFLFP